MKTMAVSRRRLIVPGLDYFWGPVDTAGLPSAVLCLLFPAVLVTGVLLNIRDDAHLLTPRATLALSWLAIGPWLYQDMVRDSLDFLGSYQSLFKKPGDWLALRETHVRRLSSTPRMVFGLTLAVLGTWVVASTVYPETAGGPLLWVVLAFGTLFLIGGVGFWAAVAMIMFVRDFSRAGVEYRPYHPDRFGGMAAVGTFAVRGSLYFSSGAIVLPLAFETIKISSSHSSSPGSVVAYLLTAMFIAFVLAIFTLPVLAVKKFADGERVRVTAEARGRLDRLMASYAAAPVHDEQLAQKIKMCFEMECVELSKLREYPYDLGVALQLAGAAVVPFAVVWITALLRGGVRP